MDSSSKKAKTLDRLFSTVARPVGVHSGGVTVTTMGNAYTNITMVAASSTETDLRSWISQNKDLLASEMTKNGGILFRGFTIPELKDFKDIFSELTGEPMEYKQRTSPRTALGDRVYTSTDHPSDQVILMHNEVSYGRSWPRKIAFFCTTQPSKGGETPIADVRAVHNLLRRSTLERFVQFGICYTRNMKKGIGLSWQEVYQTSAPPEVEVFCKENRIDFEWVSPEHLRTTWVTPAVRVHPDTGENIWFNHGYFYNQLNLDSDVREVLGLDNLPMNTFYGNGQDIEPEIIEEIGNAFEKVKFKFNWQKSDLLFLDNMLVSHGREPFSGERQIVVAMGQPMSDTE